MARRQQSRIGRHRQAQARFAPHIHKHVARRLAVAHHRTFVNLLAIGINRKYRPGRRRHFVIDADKRFKLRIEPAQRHSQIAIGLHTQALGKRDSGQRQRAAITDQGAARALVPLDRAAAIRRRSKAHVADKLEGRCGGLTQHGRRNKIFHPGRRRPPQLHGRVARGLKILHPDVILRPRHQRLRSRGLLSRILTGPRVDQQHVIDP